MLVSVLAALLSLAASPVPRPQAFTPGPVSFDIDSATFTPDGATVYFDRLEGSGSTIVLARRAGDGWSAAVAAPFSGAWSDKDPALSPDGAFMIFVSNRPAQPGGKPLDLVRADGSVRIGQGAQLWRVDRVGDGWGQPMHLNAAVNDGTRLYSPSVAGDGSIYFQRPDPVSHTFRIVRSQLLGDRYQPPIPVAIGPADSDERDPAIAPDESFMVYSANYGPKDQPNRLYIAFRDQGRWGAPVDLGEAVNHDGAEGPHLGPDARSVYFDAALPGPDGKPGPSRIWRLDLTPWLEAHRRAR